MQTMEFYRRTYYNNKTEETNQVTSTKDRNALIIKSSIQDKIF